VPIPGSVVVVGGGLAATRTVEELRLLGADSRITVVSEEAVLPYDRPPLSKDVLRGERDAVPLRDEWLSLDIDLRLGCRGVTLRPEEHVVLLDDGTQVSYDAAVLATGARPRALPGLTGRGVHVLRTAADACGLAEDVRRCGRLVVVGGGFIGCEAAASARALDAAVTMVELLPSPLARVLGAQVGAEVGRLHTAEGVTVIGGTSVLEVRGEGDERQLLLSDQSTLDAPVVLVGIGVAPDVDWLKGSGLTLDDGVLCDANGRTSIEGVWAAGDVARWWHPLYGSHVRLEHWTSAAEQGVAVARDIMGQPAPVSGVPYVWSDQYRTKFQLLGLPSPDDDVELIAVGPDGTRTLAVYGREGRVTAVLGLSAPKWVMRMRSLLAERAAYDEALRVARS
jgi:3-phenylpropionate/trans-cinnamate dioxygenase ferredoxin reductase subunit